MLEAQNFANSSHGNRLGWHHGLPEQKGARVPSRKFELPRNATSPSRSRSSFPTIVTDDPTNLTAISDATEKRSPSVGITGQHRRISRSRSFGNPGHLAPEYTSDSHRSSTPTRIVAPSATGTMPHVFTDATSCNTWKALQVAGRHDVDRTQLGLPQRPPHGRRHDRRAAPQAGRGDDGQGPTTASPNSSTWLSLGSHLASERLLLTVSTRKSSSL